MTFKELFRYSLRNPSAVFPFLLSLPKYFRLYWRLLKDRRVPIWPKLIFLAGVIYVIVPMDLIPDFIVPFFGWADDLVVFIAAARMFLRACPQQIVLEHAAEIGN